MPYPSGSNFMIITNWKSKGFACAKACSYCNWRQSPLLPHGLQSDDEILNFIRQCTKSFVTISGGGDPLYRLDENLPDLRHLCDLIHGEGYRVRIITREVGQLHRVAGLADYVSLSLDADVLRWGAGNLKNWKTGNLANSGGPDLESSLVLPPLPMPNLLGLKTQYAGLRQQLESRPNSFYYPVRGATRAKLNSIPFTQKFGHAPILMSR